MSNSKMRLKMEFIPRFLKVPGQSFFLFGPRGTGKSLWVKYCFRDAAYIDLLEPDTFRLYSSRPERLTEFIEGNPDKRQVIVDEVQKVPLLLSVVHSLIEEKRNIQFILTGSSARKIKRAGVDLLGGRAVVRSLHPFIATELGKDFSLDRALKYGLLPLIWVSKNPLDVLKAYHALYLREEVQIEALVRNIGNFNRFLEAISFSHGSVLNISNVARECEVNRKTVEGYIEILEDLLLSYRLPIFTKRARRELIDHPKFYFFDTGIFQTIRPKGSLDRVEEVTGVALEGLVAQHLRAWNAYRNDRNSLYYWKTRSGVEVDFVLYGEDGLWAFEVKNTAKVYSEYLRGLHSFKEDYPESNVIFIYRGKERLKIAGVLCIPCEEFLLGLDPNKSNIA